MSKKQQPVTVTEKVHYMEEFIDLDKFVTKGDNDQDSIIAYFKQNHAKYRRVYSGQGTMHFIVSKDGATYNIDDAFYQPETAISYVQPGQQGCKVLELGSGQGANLFHLAQEHPDIEFYGVDLCPVNKNKVSLPNVTILERNYSSLPDFPDNTFDVVYAIETIVHNSKEDKDTILKEAYRVLKPGGHLLVYDYATNKLFEDYDREMKLALSVIARGSAAALIESRMEWEEHFAKAGFQSVATNELTERILPDLKRLQKHFDAVMQHPFRAKIVFRTMPWRYTVNIISGWLGYDFTREHIGNYCEWILQKP